MTIKPKNLATSWCNSAINTNEGFINAAIYSVAQAIDHGNTGPIERMFATVRGLTGVTKNKQSKTGEQLTYSNPLQRIVGTVFPNAKGEKNTTSEYGWKFKSFDKQDYDSVAYMRLKEMTDLTINTKEFKESIFKKQAKVSKEVQALQDSITSESTEAEVIAVEAETVAQVRSEQQDAIIKGFVSKLKTLDNADLDLIFGEVRKQYNI